MTGVSYDFSMLVVITFSVYELMIVKIECVFSIS